MKLKHPNLPVECLVLVSPQFIDDRLYAEHEQLVTQVEPELEIVLSRTVIEQSVQKRHSCRLEANVIAISADAPIQIVNDRLKKQNYPVKP